MNKDKLHSGLREKLDGSRVEPSPQVWERISQTLIAQGLTTATPKPAVSVRRMRRLRIGYAAAAAVLLAAALVFTLQDTDKVLVTDNLPVVPEIPDNTPNQIVTPDIPADGTDSVIIRRCGLTVANNIEVIDDDYYWNHPSPAPPDINLEFVTIPEENGETESAVVKEIDKTEPVRQWADRDEIERTLKAGSKTRSTEGMSVGLYSSDIGSRSSEKVVQSTPYARVTSSFVAQESANAAFNSSRQTSTPTILKHRVPLSAGVSVTKGLIGRFSLESGITYSYLFSKGESLLSGGANSIRKQELHYVGIPIGIKYDMFRSRYVDLYTSVSGLFEMCVYSKDSRTIVLNGVSGGSETAKLNVRGIQPSIGVRVGAEAKLSKTFGIFVEPGFSYYFDVDRQPESFRTENQFNFAFSAGLRINFK